MLLEVLAELLDSEEAVLIFVDFEEDLAQQRDLLLRELGGDVVEGQHFELRGMGTTWVVWDLPWRIWSSSLSSRS